MTRNVWPFLSLAGRVLLALLFVLAGPGKVISSTVTASFMASAGLPNSPLLAAAVGMFEVLVGLALLVGLFTRWAALALAAFTVAASLSFHAYWSMPDDQRFVQELLFSKNMAIVGGLLVLAAMGPGTLSWDRRRAREPPARSTNSLSA
jgi:putative oxidoreductase